MSSPGTCRFYAAGQHCRFGANCRFAHVRNGSASPTPSTPSTRQGSPTNRNRGGYRGRASPRGSGSNQRGGLPARSNDGVPPQTCRIFWNTGSCDRGFECQFRHTRNPSANVPTSSGTSVATEDPAQAPDFSSIQELATVPGPNVAQASPRYNLNVSEVHNFIKPFLRDNYTFDSPSKMRGFIRVIASVNDQNKDWTSNDAQAFLAKLAEGSGILRITEILSFKPVLTVNGLGQNALSFQEGYIPLLEFFTSSLLLNSTIQKNINRLYVAVEENYDDIQEVIRKCMKEMIERNSWKDPSSPNVILHGATLFKTITSLLRQFFNRFKSAIRTHPQIVGMAQDLYAWLEAWAAGVVDGSFEDDITEVDSRRRDLITDQLREDVGRLVSIVEREFSQSIITKRPSTRPTVSPAQRREAAIMRYGQTYDPPGELRAKGPRHDNDFASISDIRIAPTQQELLSADPPYLPLNVAEAPHHLPEDSMERHLDIQFRLLREELISTLRSSIQALHRDILGMQGSSGRHRPKRDQSQLEGILKENGGAYKTSGYDSVFFSVYTSVEFAPVQAERRDLTVSLWLDPPPGAACDKGASKRAAFWKASKRLQGGSLVALVIVASGNVEIFLGVVASFGDDIAESSKASADRIQVRIRFFDPEIELRALRRETLCNGATKYALLVDSSVMFEASRPFLERFQVIEPQEMPFCQYISPTGSLVDVDVKPPRYATDPRFVYDLKCLAKEPASRNRINNLDISRPNAVEQARRQLTESSTLDPSQIDAVLNSLTREVSLIQGPPGTGKSFTGRELLKVLFASRIKPIVLIAYTNHALDHMLSEVLDARITNKVVRLGSRSSDERIAEYTLDKIERAAAQTSLSRSVGRQFGVMKELEKDMRHVMENIQLPRISASAIQQYLEIYYSDHASSLSNPPYWIGELFHRRWADESENGAWTQVAANRKEQKEVNDSSQTIYGLWKLGEDLTFLAPPPPSNLPGPSTPEAAVAQHPVSQTASEVENFFEALGLGGGRPPIPVTDRPLSSLIGDGYIWRMSLNERKRLSATWEEEIRVQAYETNLDRYNELRDRYKEACKEYEDMKDEMRRQLLGQVDLIACTTTGAAKLTSLISSISPRVLMVEEAGQVLEAHILSSLSPSIQHLICIGDPQQLRPNVATFALSMDSERGRTYFKFDRSLMERLADSGFPMTQLNVQRRMRPVISNFIRTILYPKLEDHDVVQAYPPVKGMQKDVFFLNHNHAEGGADDSVSKFNSFEVEMIRDLVLYFLKQGKYSGPGDIAVLCAYLGQLQKVRAVLKDMKIAVSVDARDEEELFKQGLDDETSYEEVNIAKHIRLGTVDIYQGQEAKIVIVSLVRNTGDFNASASIGFLKSSNRINVALSRAKHGMYILGNAANLRSNPTWSTIIDDMEEKQLIGNALPIVCARHPSEIGMVMNPKDLQRFAPEGGCLRPCEHQLNCGHMCPSVCHITLDNHQSMFCHMPCGRTPCPRSHPCSKKCSETCGDCMFPMTNIRLPCGHTKKKLGCHFLEKLDQVKCEKMVTKKLPHCEHSAEMRCSDDPSLVECRKVCGGTMGCCSKPCKSKCFECQAVTRAGVDVPDTQNGLHGESLIARVSHRTHPCERLLYCLHACGQDCHPKDVPCNLACKQKCRQECAHQTCQKHCSVPCPPCMEPCVWQCSHAACPVTCGSICTRLPCDESCTNTLKCGHRCPSICGEICDDQKCVLCLDDSYKHEIVDFLMQRQLHELDLASDEVSERLITLKCGHMFTVETLDGHCDMRAFYVVDDATGSYISTQVPPVAYQSPPTCPTCRGPINSLRYGRVTKRAALDILEQNVASKLSRSLEDLGPSLETASSSLSSMKESVQKLSQDITGVHAIDEERRNAELVKPSQPLALSLLNASALSSVHGFSSTEAKDFGTVVGHILKTYGKVHRIATTQSAHVRAYEGARATLYRLELDLLTHNPEIVTDTPEDLALASVERSIGQPPPKADSRFQVESFFYTLQLRYILAEIGRERIDAIRPASTDPLQDQHKATWISFIRFLYNSCILDARKALEISKRSSASKQAARCGVYVLQSQFELFRFNTLTEAKCLRMQDPTYAESRQRLGDQVADESVSMRHQGQRLQAEYVRSRPQGDLKAHRENIKWFEDNCNDKITKIIDETQQLEEYIRNGGAYEPLSASEIKDIVKAFNFSTTGHFYNCPNGHPFVITECGGAMEVLTCPECGAQIGGGSHRLLDSNSTAPEFEAELRNRPGGVIQGFY